MYIYIYIIYVAINIVDVKSEMIEKQEFMFIYIRPYPKEIINLRSLAINIYVK